MSNRIENLGDYNLVRIDLQNANGSREELYERIGKTFVAKAAPKQIAIGAISTLGIGLLLKLGKKGVEYYQERKSLMQKEPELKKEFMATTKTVETETEKQGGTEK